MGSVLWDLPGAVAAAIGEAAERYSGNIVPPGLRRASFEQLQAADEDALDPTGLALYSDAQYNERGFPFCRFPPDLPVRWVEGQDVLTRAPVWVPASLVWTNYFAHGFSVGEPITNATVYAGIAAGSDRTHAESSAVRELIERDAMTLTWTTGATGARLQAPHWLERLASGPTGELRTTFVTFPSDFGAPCVGALMRDQVRGYLTLGTAWYPDVTAAACVKALAEAAHIQTVMADLNDPDSAFGPLTRSPDSPLKPWRQDRSYLLDYRPDWHDAVDPGCHMQAYLDPQLADDLERELTSWPLLDSEMHEPLGSPPAMDLPGIVATLTDAGIRAVSVDVTTSDVRRAGLSVVRVIASGLYSNGAAAFPFLGGTRMDRRANGTGLRLQPLPH
ncbi:MAG: YcaO-like family protein [Acidimicrobiales bacterium]